jgi:hypothetical protein
MAMAGMRFVIFALATSFTVCCTKSGNEGEDQRRTGTPALLVLIVRSQAHYSPARRSSS